MLWAAGSAGTCAGLGVVACGAAGGACCCAGTGARALDVKVGAVAAGNMDAGLCAVWQAEAHRIPTVSIAIRTLSFATRIFFYEIQIAPIR